MKKFLISIIGLFTAVLLIQAENDVTQFWECLSMVLNQT